MKKILLVAIAIITITSCNNTGKKGEQTENTSANTGMTANAEATANTEIETKATNFYGTYKGTLPAADCEGIETTLTINSDSTYTLKSKYLDKEREAIETNGVYNMVNNTLIELVTPSSGDKTYYKILDNNRIMLSDQEGTINNGELAEFYILKKE